MGVNILKSYLVCGLNHKFTIQIGFGVYNLGLIIEKKHIRIMLIWWHICLSF